jgi:hypothetical protein
MREAADDGRHSTFKSAGKVQVRYFPGILNFDQRCSIFRLFERISNYYCNRLAIEPDDIILQNV